MTIKTSLSIATVAALALFAAANPANAAGAFPSRDVNVGMLNLASPKGVDAAQAMIRHAARGVCFDAGDTVADRTAAMRCYKTAVAEGYARIGTLRTAQIESRNVHLASK